MSQEPKGIVVGFPGKWKGNPPLPANTAQVEATQSRLNKFYISKTLEVVTSQLFHAIHLGLKLPVVLDKNFKKDLALVNESIKSLLYKAHGYPHPLQEVAAGADFSEWIDIAAPKDETPPPKSFA